MSYSMSLNMHNKQTQSLKQAQRLIMSPQMQQAIHLLQLPIQELNTAINAELEQNPILEYSQEQVNERPDGADNSLIEQLQESTGELSSESDTPVEQEINFSDNDFEAFRQVDEEFRDHFAESGSFQGRRTAEDDKLQTFKETLICGERSLFEYLMEQARQNFDDPQELLWAEVLIGHFDERGFLENSLEEIGLLNGIPEDQLKMILDEIQSFDPIGVGARNLADSLLLQLKFKGKRRTLAYRVIEQHYEDLLHNRIPVIAKKLGVSVTDVREAIESEITKLDLSPGSAFSRGTAHAIFPDVTVREEGGMLIVDVNDDRLPSIRVSHRYINMLESKQCPEETKEYVKMKVQSGKWLLRNIHQRNETILRITEHLVQKQQEFFSSPEGKLLPLTMKSVAEALELHESTIARAVANKYVDCSRGILALRSFFTNAYTSKHGEDISSRTVKDALLEIIKSEDKARPLSDEQLSKAIQKKGVSCARRTVAKYRKELNIGNASQRKLHK